MNLRLRMNHTKLCSEFLSLLYWAMLAANTIGPGTVVTCARAGAEFDLQVIFPDCVLSSVQLVFCSLIDGDGSYCCSCSSLMQ